MEKFLINKKFYVRIKDIFELVETYPNDMQLGEQLRKIYWKNGGLKGNPKDVEKN